MRYRRVEPNALLSDPAPGLYAVSAQLVARIPAMGASMTPAAGAWLQRMTPVAIVGHAIYIYEVR